MTYYCHVLDVMMNMSLINEQPLKKGLYKSDETRRRIQMHEEIIAKAGEIVGKNTGETSYCVLALLDPDGYPTASTISASKTQGIQWITFCTGLDTPKTRRIVNCNRASVCFNSPDYNITLVGTMEVITDPEVKKEMWYGGLASHFSGPEDPNYCVLRFTTKRYSLLVDWKEARGDLQMGT
jgi:general stress protein 26